jgi:hypothetical protein
MNYRILMRVSKYRREILVGCLVYAALVAKDLISFIRQLT